MQRPLPSFPAHAQGAGLVLLRASVTLAVLVAAIEHVRRTGDAWPVVVSVAAVSGLGLGLWTAASCVLALSIELACALCDGSGVSLRTGVGIVQGLALLLLGPGAYSVDGHRFGRRVVVIPK